MAGWPAWELDLIDRFVQKEPSAFDRVEIAIARLTAMYAAYHRPSGARVPKVSDYLPYMNAWPIEGGRYSDLDREYLAELL